MAKRESILLSHFISLCRDTFIFIVLYFYTCVIFRHVLYLLFSLLSFLVFGLKT